MMPVIKFIIFLLIVLLPCQLPAADNIRIISVTGKSETIVKPQFAIIMVNMKCVRKEMNQSHDELMKSMTKLSAALATIGLTEKDIKRSFILQGPEYSYVKDAEVLKGYYSQCQIDLHVNDIGNMPSVYEKLADFKTLSIQSTTFKRNDESEIRKVEYEKALQAAKKKAEYMTQVLQTNIGKVHAIQEINLEDGSVFSAAKDRVAANIMPTQKEYNELGGAEYGNIKITALVAVEFELE